MSKEADLIIVSNFTQSLTLLPLHLHVLYGMYWHSNSSLNPIYILRVIRHSAVAVYQKTYGFSVMEHIFALFLTMQH